MIKNNTDASTYVNSMTAQLRKGFLPYCVMKICAKEPRYASEIIKQLHFIDMVVVEGTIYPLLSRLQKEGILEYRWVESEQGPPRKYYETSTYGCEVINEMSQRMEILEKAIESI